jgi:pyridoxamine 5'-phosphate oxidase
MVAADSEDVPGNPIEKTRRGDLGRLDDPLDDAPLERLAAWIAEARDHPKIRNADAMALSTLDARGDPQVRFVLCRGLEVERARATFYTNEHSAKGRELAAHGRASAAFYWDPLGRQARLSGRVERATDAESDAYFGSRHPLSQLAAWASDQSAPIASRVALEERLAAARATHGGGDPQPIPRPPHWGGYHLLIERVELWVEGKGRLHDRAVWHRDVGRDGASMWKVQRLQP